MKVHNWSSVAIYKCSFPGQISERLNVVRECRRRQATPTCQELPIVQSPAVLSHTSSPAF